MSDSFDLEDKLYHNTDTTVSAFTTSFMKIVSQHHINDSAASDLLNLIASILPCPNNCPSLFQLHKQTKIELQDVQIVSKLDGTFYLLDIEKQVKSIIKRYPDIFKTIYNHYQNFQFPNVVKDIYDGSKFVFSDSAHVKYVYILANFDGVQPAHKSKSYNLWPFTFSIANLEPRERKKFQNLVLCSLYYGKKKPDFQYCLKLVVNMIQKFEIHADAFRIKLKIVAFIADLPAKASSLNMNQFNGYFGCAFCEIKGVYCKDHHKMLFPIETTPSIIRNAESHKIYAQNAFNTGKAFKGVKGTTPLADIMEVPLLACLDPMHLVYLGITKTMFLHFLNKGIIDEVSLSNIVLNVSVPLYFKRKLRSLKEAAYWKANEWKNFLLYYSVTCLFISESPPEIIALVSLLSTAIYILYSDGVTQEDVNDSKKLILTFQHYLCKLFGDSVMTYSCHALSHLPLQVQMFGPLWCISASLFESSFGLLTASVTGTRNEASLIVSRFIRYYNCVLESNVVNACSTKIKDKYGVIRLGKIKPITLEILLNYDLVFNNDILELYRIRVNNHYFTSYAYSRKGQSASYLVTSIENDSLVFLKINFIIMSQNIILCLCNKFQSQRSWLTMVPESLLHESISDLLCNKCPLYSLKEDSYLVIPAYKLSNHFICVSNNDYCYGIPILNDFEHD